MDFKEIALGMLVHIMVISMFTGCGGYDYVVKCTFYLGNIKLSKVTA